MNVRKFLLKKFPTNKYMDCPVPKNYYGVMQEYAEAYHESKVKELNLDLVMQQRELFYNFITWYNAKPNKDKNKMIFTSTIEEYLKL